MKYLSLFSGIGGFELGIQQAYVETTKRSKKRGSKEDTQRNKGQRLLSKKGQGVGSKAGQSSKYNRNILNKGQPTCIGYSEIDKYAIQIYEKHFNHKNYGDIRDIKELPDFELLIGGFPCQSFSIAGKRGGFNDTRGTLFFEIARIVREKQPRLLLLENVKGLLSHDKGRTFFTIISTLDELGYDIQWQVLNSKNFGVPQNRERVFIIGHLRGTSRQEVFPFGETAEENPIKEFYRQPLRYLDRNQKNIKGDYGYALDASGTWGISDGSKIRRLTPTECERLQGFPDGWTKDVSDTQRYKTLGNAVTVNVIKSIAEKMFYKTN